MDTTMGFFDEDLVFWKTYNLLNYKYLNKPKL